MKNKRLSIWWITGIVLFLAFTMTQCSSTKSVSNLDKADVSRMLEDHAFIFVADRVNPFRGRTRVLTSNYDVSVNNDSLVSYLPYFGRAYSAPMDPSDVSTQFTSTDFTYIVTQPKDNQWTLIMKPKDQSAIQELSFTIFENGTTTLHLTSTSKDAISYSGYLKKIEK